MTIKNITDKEYNLILDTLDFYSMISGEFVSYDENMSLNHDIMILKNKMKEAFEYED